MKLSLISIVIVVTALMQSCPAQAAASASPAAPNTVEQPDQEMHITVGGFSREYLVHVPNRYTSTIPSALVLCLHGSGATSRQMARQYGWEEKADAKNFIAVFPQGLPLDPTQPASRRNAAVWRDGREDYPARGVDDVAFLTAALAEVEQRYTVNKHRVYVSGFSNGAGMTFRLASVLADQIAAIAPVSAPLWIRPAHIARPVSLLFIVGTADPLNPLAGGNVTMRGNVEHRAPILETVSAWAVLDGCPAAFRTVASIPGVHQTVYAPGRQGAEVVCLTIEGMKHHWPLKSKNPSLAQNDLIDAPTVIWDFFEKHPRR